jgi:hypothetical protein
MAAIEVIETVTDEVNDVAASLSAELIEEETTDELPAPEEEQLQQQDDSVATLKVIATTDQNSHFQQIGSYIDDSSVEQQHNVYESNVLLNPSASLSLSSATHADQHHYIPDNAEFKQQQQQQKDNNQKGKKMTLISLLGWLFLVQLVLLFICLFYRQILLFQQNV